MLGNLIKNIDIIGPKPDLYVQKNVRYKTFLGGMLTILTVIFSVLCFTGFGLDIFQKRNPESITTRAFVEYPVLNNSQLNYMLAPVFLGGRAIPDIRRKLQMTFTFADTDPHAKHLPNSLTTQWYHVMKRLI